MRWPWQKSSGARRVSVRRERATPGERLRQLLTNPKTGYAAIIATASVLVLSVVTWWASGQPMVRLGRLAERTVVAREAFSMPDPARTAERRALAQDRAARIFVERPDLRSTVDGLAQLPATLRDAETLDQVAPELRDRFDLDQDELDAVRTLVTEDGVAPRWTEAMERLLRAMRRAPLVDSATWQNERQRSAQLGGSEAGETAVVWLLEEDTEDTIHTTAAILVNVASEEQRREAAQRVVQGASLENAALGRLVAGRLLKLNEPTYRLDEARTAARQAVVVDGIEEAFLEVQAGQVIVRRGEPVGLETIALLQSEREAVARERGVFSLGSRLAGSLAVCALMTVGLTMYLAWYCPRVARNPHSSEDFRNLIAANVAPKPWTTDSLEILQSRSMAGISRLRLDDSVRTLAHFLV